MKIYTSTKTAFDALISVTKELNVFMKANYTEQSVEVDIMTFDDFETIATEVEWDIYS